MAKLRTGAALLLLLAFPAGAQEIQGTCAFRFQATSTLHDFAGSAACLPFRAELGTDAAGRRVLPSATVEIPVDGMETGNGKRDAQMRDMFRSDRFPNIRGAVRDVDVDGIREAIGREGKASLPIRLKIRDVERRVAATVTNLRVEGDEAGFDLEFPISLSEFGLEPPTVFFFIRVGDRVVVRGNVRLRGSS